MSPIFSTLVFAVAATAQITTSIWMPSGLDDQEVGFYASIIGNENGKTTMALTYDNNTDTENISYYDYTAPSTITIQGSTWYETQTTTTDSFEDAVGTYGLSCSLPTQTRARPTCVYSQGGPLAYKVYCSDYSSYTDVYTSTWEQTYTSDEFGPETVYTGVETVDYRTYIPDFCTEGSTLPEDIAKTTMTVSRGYVQTYQVVITAGQEKLAATAGASVSNSGAPTTGTGAVATGANASGTGPLQASGTGAAPVMTAAPALLGLGAAMAAFVL
ncbi:hypothetical protein BDV96DRAFT_595559 [Lophiotrema nucula]|uniref:Uncharacterized protein n=1 Tax=Lophiotrema nucula TaxID=690887 RepID=A0A6A5ZLS7_9PLEO|nr:hypothetical protein BDV96DRAFT_595559 [Lophiotrema nucula]